jgi:Flp pilus assembly protein TadD
VAVSEWVDPSVRDHLQHALQLRAGLSEDDKTLLDALAPAVLDTREAETTISRLGELANRAPDSFEARSALAIRLVHARRLEDALREANALSASTALGQYLTARVHLETDDLAQAQSSLDACLRQAPASGDCTELSVTLALNEGDCARAEREGRRFIASSPDDADPYLFLASALAGLGRSPDEVHAALEQRWAREPADERPLHRCRDEGLVWAMRGDFARAEESLRSCARRSARGGADVRKVRR